MKPTQHLYLLRLMLAMDWIALKDVKPALPASHRRDLVSSHLIEIERRGRSQYVRLSDRGWVWCAENLQTPIAMKRNHAASLLEGMLARMGNWLERHNTSLAEFVSAVPHEIASESTEDNEVQVLEELNRNLEEMVEQAALAIGLGNTKVRVRLAELRNRLPSVSQLDLDRALLQMSMDGRLHLMSLDNPYEISEQDSKAALYTPSGEVRHLLYWAG